MTKQNFSIQFFKMKWICIVGILFAIISCAPKTQILVQTPAEIDTKGIHNVALGTFEVMLVKQSSKQEGNGNWETKVLPLSQEVKDSISRQIRARVVSGLAATPYFKIIYTDEFAAIENDAAFSELIAAAGYKTKDVDAVINGKVWIEIQKTDGAEIAKKEMQFVTGTRGRRGGSNKIDISVEKVLWWPYKNMRGNLTLEMKLTRLYPTEVLAVTVDTRTFSHKVGGAPASLLDNLKSASQTVSNLFATNKNKNSNQIENSDNVMPSENELIGDLAESIASSFIRRITVTEKFVSYPIAESGDQQAKLLIEAGAYEMAIHRLQSVTGNNRQKEIHPDDLYNLGLSFEATGDYGLAAITYKEALAMEKDNLLYAQGVGRIELVLREHPRLKQQLARK